MSATYTDDFDIEFPGPPGESQADILRRTGQYGVLPSDTDPQVMEKLNGVLTAALATAKKYARSGSFAERDTIPLDETTRGLTFKVTTEETGLFQEWREYEVRLAGDRDGPTREWAFLTEAKWCALYTEREKLHFGIVPFKGELPIANQEGMAAALSDLQAVSRVRLGDFRATLLSTGANPKARLSWNQYGLKPDSQVVSWDGYSIPLDGGVTELETSDWTAALPLFIYSNSLGDITDVTTRWSQLLAASLGVGLFSVARYSSDVRQVKRAGLEPLMLTIGGTLPAGGTYANVTHIDGLAVTDPTFPSSPQSILNTGDPSIVTGVSMGGLVLAGAEVRHANLSISNAAATNYRIVQDAGQPALALTGPVQFVPDVALARTGSRTGIWVGQNYYYSGVPNTDGDHTNPQMFIDIAKMVGATKGGPAFILPIIPNASWPAEGSPVGPINGVEYGFRGRAAMAAANARLEALYPHLYLRNSAGQDLNAWLQAHGNGSANDNADIAAGYTPRSLRLSGDGLHLNPAGDALVAEFVEDALGVQATPPAITEATSFSLVAVGTQKRRYPEDPIVTMDSAVVRASVGFEAQLVDEVEQIKQAQASGASYYPTRAAGAGARSVGDFFTSNETGETRYYEVTGAAPFYVDRGRVSEEVTKSTVGLSNVDNTSDLAKPVSTAQQTALDTKVAEDVFNGTVAEIAGDLVAQKAALDARTITATPEAPAILRALGDKLDELPRSIKSLVSGLSGNGGSGGGTDMTTKITNALKSGSRNIIVPPDVGDYVIDGRVTFPNPGFPSMTITGQRGARFRQMQGNITFDMGNTSDLTLRGLSMIYGQPRVAGPGDGFRGDVRGSTWCGIFTAGDRVTIDDCDIEGFVTGICAFAWDVVGNTGEFERFDNKILNTRVRNVQFGVLVRKQVNLLIANMQARDISLSSGSANPEHPVYVTGNSNTRSRNLTLVGLNVDNCGSTAAQIKWTDGFTLSGLSVNKSALVSVAGSTNGVIKGVSGRSVRGIGYSNFIAGLGYSSPGNAMVIASQDDGLASELTSRPSAITVSGVDVTMEPGTTSGLAVNEGVAALLVNGDRVKVSDYKVGISPAADKSGKYVATVCGDQNDIAVEAYSTTGFKARMFQVGTSNAGEAQPGRMTLRAAGTGLLDILTVDAGVNAEPVAPKVKPTIRAVFDPAMLGATWFLNNNPTPKANVLIERVRTEVVLTPTGTTHAPSHVGSATVFVLRPGADAWTVNSPPGLSATGTPVGSTMEYLVENTTLAALGAATWNSFNFKTAFASPAPGKSVLYKFRFDGTKWVEI